MIATFKKTKKGPAPSTKQQPIPQPLRLKMTIPTTKAESNSPNHWAAKFKQEQAHRKLLSLLHLQELTDLLSLINISMREPNNTIFLEMATSSIGGVVLVARASFEDRFKEGKSQNLLYWLALATDEIKNRTTRKETA